MSAKSFHWVANRRIKIAVDRYREEGEYVPEADKWREPELWERSGHVRKVPGPPPVMPGGNGCHTHDLKEGKCSKCDFVEKDPVADAILAEASKVLAEPVPKPEPETKPESTPEVKPLATPSEVSATMVGPSSMDAKPTPEPEQDPEPEPEPNQELVTVPAADSEPETDPGEGDGGESEPETDPEDAGEEYEPHTKSELMRMRKADLQDLALEWDLVVGDAKKPDIIAAIMEAQEG